MSKQEHIEAFTFGAPEPVLDGHDILNYAECYLIDDYYEPPISMHGLAKSLRCNTHHASAIVVKKNIIMSSYKPNKLLSKQELVKFIQDYLVFGNAYFEVVKNKLGKPIKILTSPAKYTRRTKDGGYVFLQNYIDKHYFKQDSVFHLLEPDINQEIYGVPEYLASLNSAWLNESATLFRRKYYENGTHAGFVMYVTDTAHDEKDIKGLRQALKDSKGPGNFRNLFMYAPNGKKDGLQIIPISNVQAKDEFFNIKNVTRDDVLAAHRVPPQLMGVVTANTTNYDSVQNVAKVFNRNEITPLCERLKELNDWLGIKVMDFDEYKIEGDE